MTVKTWKKLVTFDPMADGKFNLEGTVAIIAEARDISVDEVEAMQMDDLLPEYLACVKEANKLVFSKLDKVPKNGSEDSVVA